MDEINVVYRSNGIQYSSLTYIMHKVHLQSVIKLYNFFLKLILVLYQKDD